MTKPRKSKPKPPTPREPIPPGSTVLALDVSSRATGLALLWRSEAGVRIRALRLVKPPAAWDEFTRVDLMTRQVVEFVEANQPIGLAILEWVDGIPWAGRKYVRSMAQHLDRCKSAQAHVRQALKPLVDRIETVSATEWSRRIPKEDRAKALAERHWRYATFRGDKGLDVADALGIGLWRLEGES